MSSVRNAMRTIGRLAVAAGVIAVAGIVVGKPFVQEVRADVHHAVYDPVDDWWYCLGTPLNCDDEEGDG